MLFTDNTRKLYANSPLVEVICQLRFPTLEELNGGEPTQFKEAIGELFPQYAPRQEQPAPQLVNGKVEQPAPITNHTFVSEDGLWKVNLTQNFIALSTLRYVQWEDFAGKLDKVLASFIELYRPAHFERIGLRYVNAISRKRLGLEEELWDDLIQSPFIGILSEPDVDERRVGKSALDVEMVLEDGSRLKLHAGPGLLGNGQKDPEPKFILDGDFSVTAKEISAEQLAGGLTALHDHAVRLFNAATTKELKEAMGPSELQ